VKDARGRKKKNIDGKKRGRGALVPIAPKVRRRKKKREGVSSEIGKKRVWGTNSRENARAMCKKDRLKLGLRKRRGVLTGVAQKKRDTGGGMPVFLREEKERKRPRSAGVITKIFP